MYHRHLSMIALTTILSSTCLSFGPAPRFYSRNLTIRKGLSIPATPPENMFRDEIEETLANKTSLLSRISSFHNPIALQAVRQTEWLRHLRTTQNISPSFWDACGYNFAEGGAGPHARTLYPISKEDAPQLHAAIAQYAQQLDLEIPMILMIDDAKLFNAFATCMRRRSGFLIIARGLLNATSTQQLKGIIAHELGHIHHRHVPKTLGLIVGLIGSGLLAFLVSYFIVVLKGKESSERFCAWALPSAIGYGLSIPLIQALVSRRQEQQADQTAAQLDLAAGYSAMKAIERYENKVFEDELTTAQELIEHRYKEIDSQTTQEYVSMLEKTKQMADKFREPGGLSKLLSTHPSTSERIEYFENSVSSQEMLSED